jgi:hypothetical protein
VNNGKKGFKRQKCHLLISSWRHNMLALIARTPQAHTMWQDTVDVEGIHDAQSGTPHPNLLGPSLTTYGAFSK